MKMVIEINMDNAAFEEDAGAEALRIITGKLLSLEINQEKVGMVALMDSNGNKVGKLTILES